MVWSSSPLVCGGLFNSNDTSNPQWNQACFIIFDVVEENLKDLPFRDRMQLISNLKKTHVYPVVMRDCISREQVDRVFTTVPYYKAKVKV